MKVRVISGEARGRSLKAVKGNRTRPTTDKVKESIFNIIGPYFDGGMVLDLYSGSGGLGIEALSRGMEFAVFIDRSKQAFDVIQENVRLCRYEPKSEIYRNDVSRAIFLLAKREMQFNLIFMDPPYADQQIKKDIQALIKGQLFKDDSLIVIEHDTSISLPDSFEGHLNLWKRNDYHGKTAVSIYVFESGKEKLSE